jgi:hypothetical protein
MAKSGPLPGQTASVPGSTPYEPTAPSQHLPFGGRGNLPERRVSFARRSLDHLVGAGEQRLRNSEAERLRGLEVDDQLEFGRLLHRQVRRLGAF